MKTFIKTIAVILLAVGCFTIGWYTSTKGYRVVNSDGASVVKSNSAQMVKEENARMGREVIGKDEAEAEKLLANEHRTFFVGKRDGKDQEYKGQKTFTNLTVEVKDGKVVKVMGWY